MSGSTRMLIAGNWKMNGLLSEADAFIAELRENPAPEHIEIALMPPFTLLHPMQKKLSEKGVVLGAQNVYYEDKGAFTGSICPIMLRDAGCHYVILGHSERRSIIGESNAQIRSKLNACWLHGLEPILCIGETLEQREKGVTNHVLAEQLAVLKGAPKDKALTVAYEPVWAIGTGENATPEQAVEAHQFIRHWFDRRFQPGTGNQITVLYGGSMKPVNAQSLLLNDDIDGGLIGGASLDASKFAELVSIASSLS